MNSIDGGGGEHHQQINQCKVVEIVSSAPIATETQAFKIMKKFLEMDKAKLMDPSNILEFEDTQLVQRAQWNRLRRVAHEIPVKDRNGNFVQPDDRQDLVEPWLLADDFNDTELNAANDAAAAAAAIEKERNDARRFDGRYDIDDNDDAGDPMMSSPTMIGSSTTKKRSRSMAMDDNDGEADIVPPVLVAGGIKSEHGHDDSERRKEKKRLKKEKKEAKKQAKKEKKEAKKLAKKEKKRIKKEKT